MPALPLLPFLLNLPTSLLYLITIRLSICTQAHARGHKLFNDEGGTSRVRSANTLWRIRRPRMRRLKKLEKRGRRFVVWPPYQLPIAAHWRRLLRLHTLALPQHWSVEVPNSLHAAARIRASAKET